MIPPSSSDSDFNGDGFGGNSFGGNGHNGNAAATGLLIPPRATLPAEPIADWIDSPAAWNPAAQQQGVNFLEFLRGLQRRWMLALGVAGGLAFLVMAAVYLFLPSPEVSTAYLRVSPVKPSYLEGNNRSARSVSPDEVQRNQQNQQAFCKSEDVLRAVVREPKVQETKMMQENRGRPVDFLTDELQVGFVPRSDIMFVRLKGDDKTELATIVNEVVNQFLLQGVQKERADLRKKTVDLREVVRGKQQELDAARKRAKEKAETVGASTAANARVYNEVMLSELMKLRKQQADAEALHSLTVTNYHLANAEFSEFKRRGVTDTMLDAALASDLIYGDMKSRAMQMEQALRAQGPRAAQLGAGRQLAQGYQELDRQVKDFRRQASQKLRKGYEEQMTSRISLLMQEVQIHYKRAVEKKDAADKMMEEVKKKTQSTEDLAADEDLIMRLVEFVNQKSTIIADWDLELRAPDRIEIMQQATSPEHSSSMFRIMMALGSGVLAGGFGLCAVGVWEYFKRRLSTPDDVTSQLGLNLVGTVPALPSRAGAAAGRGISAEQFDAILADSIDSVRATLIHGSPSGGNRTVMVTSAWDGEGKTTVASQLAASLARCGRRTLLVDADFRSPTLHELFDMPNDRGLCEVLRGEVEPHKAIRETPAANLWLLSAGDFCHRSVQALENDAFGMLFRELKSEYDFVIVDTAPVLVVADPMLIGQHVDGAIVSARLGYSQRPKIDEAVKRLRAVGVVIYGAVVNGTKPVRSRRAGERPALTSSGA